MDRVQPSTVDPSPDRSLHCEDCGRVQGEAEPGWVRVAYPALNRGEFGDRVFLYYCPVHAVQFELHHPNVAPVS